ncbi:hypothetical protein CONLIGDRAFT_629738, partial [Coniochaeta ligniaria NRRL 30616]
MASNSSNPAGNQGIHLKSMMPGGLFHWPGYPRVTHRAEIDFKIQDAMRNHGGPGFRFQRRAVIDLLVAAIVALTAALGCIEPGMTDEHIAMVSAIAIVQAQIPWLDALSADVIDALFSALRTARYNYLEASTDEVLERDINRHWGTNAERLALAVDDFQKAIWDRDEAENNHLATAAGVMSLVGNDFGLTQPGPPTAANTPAPALPPLPRTHLTSRPLTEGEERRMRGAWAAAARELDEERRLMEEEEEEARRLAAAEEAALYQANDEMDL